MANIEAKIVLTGGPCAGKTTALTKIEEYFTDLGYKVLIVSESATELIKGGAIPVKDLSMVEFQDAILNYQMMKEQVYDGISKNLSCDKCIIVYDRGLMDNSAYVSKEEFDGLLMKYNYSRLDLMDRYDLVLHLVTAADGAVEFYTLSNNEARSETVEEAIDLDKKTMNAWKGHRNFNIIDNTTTFDIKLKKVIESIENLIGTSRVHKQHKYLVDASTISLSFLDKALKIDIEQVYLGTSSYEKRLRKRTLNGDSTYYYTVQKYDILGTSHVLTDKKIKAKEYEELLASSDSYRVVNKTRYSFINGKSVFKLDIFDDGVAILEIDSDEYELPKDIKVIADITSNKEFYNNSLAVCKNAKVKQLI